MASLITSRYKYISAKGLIESFSKTGIDRDYYYIFAANHQDYPNNVISDVNSNVNDTVNDVYRNMIFGKLVQQTDASIMIRRVPWTSGVVYAIYDDKDPQLNLKDFFVYTYGSGLFHIWKCLSNKNDSPSIIEPLFPIGTDGIVYLSDGYVWKYMYSLNVTTFDKFTSPEYIPYVANNTVISQAVNGQINNIKIIAPGGGYSNYISSAYFQSGDVKAFSNPLFYKISTADASNVYDFYEGCLLYIKSGTGAGQYRTIKSYIVQNTTKYVVLDSPFTVQPDNTSMYLISPRVYLQGDQTESNTTIAYAEIDITTSNSVTNIVILDPGKDYKVATANVYASSYVGVTVPAVVRPILSPPGGHGANPPDELYCSTAAFSMRFTGSEGNTIPTSGQYRQIGIVANPIFTSIDVNHNGTRGSFQANEQVISFYPRRVQANVSIGIGNNIMTTSDNTANFNQLFETGDKLYLSDGINDFVYTVNTINTNTELTVSQLSIYDFTDATAHYVNIQAEGTVGTLFANNLTTTNVRGQIKTDAYLIGMDTGALITSINDLSISNKQKSFNTFVATYQYEGLVVTGPFQNNEILVQGNNVSNALLYSAETYGGTTTFYTTNQNGIFNTSNTIYGASSNAVATLNTKYLPEVVFGSGDILYVENLDPISRAGGQSETFKLIFEF